MATSNILRNPIRTPELQNLPTGDVRRGLRNALIQTDANYDLAAEAEALASGDLAEAASRRQMVNLRERQAGLTPLRVGRVEDVNGIGDAIDYAQGQMGSGMGSMADPLAAGLGAGGAGQALSAIPNPLARAAGGILRGAGTVLAPAAVSARQLKGEFYGQARENPELMRGNSAAAVNDMANLAGAAGGALDAIVPGRVARGLVGAGQRAAGGGLRRFGQDVATEGLTEVGQGEVGRGLRGVLDPNQDTSGFASDRLNEAVGGAIGDAPFSAMGAAADAGYGQADRAVSRGVGAAQRGATAVQAKAGEVVDLATGAVKEGTGRARGKVIDLRTQLKERTNTAKSGWQQQQEEFDLLNLQPNGIDPATPEFQQWFTDNRERRNTLVRERLSGMAEDAEAQRILQGMDNPETADTAIDEGAAYVADNMRFDNVARAADRAGAAARKAGGFVASIGKAAWEGAKRKQSLQGGEGAAESDPELMGVFMEDAAQREASRFPKAQGAAKVPAFMGRMGQELGEMIQAGVVADDKAMLHIDRMAQHMAGAYGQAATGVAEELARMQPSDLTQMLVERVGQALSATGDTSTVRRSAGEQLVALLPPQVEKRLLREGINLRNDEGKRQLLGMVEALSMGRAPAEARRQLASIVGGDEVVNQMVEAIAPTVPEADGDITTVSEEQMAEQGLRMDESGNLLDVDEEAPEGSTTESAQSFEERQAQKKLDKRSGAKYYAFGRRPSIDNSKERRDPFGYTEKLSKSDLQSRLAAGEDGPRRPQLMRQDQTLSSGESAIDNKIAAMRRYLGDDNVEVASRSAKEVLDDLGAQPAKRLQLFADYMFQEGKEVGGEQGERMRDLGRTARRVLRDVLVGARAGKGAVAGTTDTKAQSTAGERNKVKKAMERYFNERYLVVGERMSDADPERIERADFDNMVAAGKTVMAMREAKDNPAHAHKNNILFFEDEKGNSMPIKADDVVKHARTARRATENESAGGSGQWVKDLMSGIASLVESGYATALPTRTDAAGEVESFADGIPLNLMLPSGKLYKSVVAEKRRKPKTLLTEESDNNRSLRVAVDQARNTKEFTPDDVANASPKRSDADEREGLRVRTLSQGMAAENLPQNPQALAREAAKAPRSAPALPPAPTTRPVEGSVSADQRRLDVSSPRKFLDSLRTLHDSAVEEGDSQGGRFAAATGRMNVKAIGDRAAQKARVADIRRLDDAYSAFINADRVPFTEKQDAMAQVLLRRLRQSHAYVWDDAPEVAATPGKSRAAPSGEHESRLEEISNYTIDAAPALQLAQRAATDAMFEAIGSGVSRSELFRAEPFRPVWKQIRELESQGLDTSRVIRRIAMTADQLYGMNPSEQTESKARARLLEGGGPLSQFMADITADSGVANTFKVVAGAVTKIAGSTMVRMAGPEMQGDGAYSATRNDIRVKAYGSLDPVSTVLHEGVHAATVRALEQDPALTRATYALMAHVVKEDPSLQAAYGLSSTLEFMAEGMSNVGLQKRLHEIRASRAVSRYLGETVGNAWDAFVGLMRKAMGLKPEEDSALMQLFELTGRAMKARAGLGLMSSVNDVRAHMSMRIVPARVVAERIQRLRALKYELEAELEISQYLESMETRLENADPNDTGPMFAHRDSVELELLAAYLESKTSGTISKAEVQNAIIMIDKASLRYSFPRTLSAQTSFAQRSTQAEQDQAKTYVERVLGPAVKTVFKDITGYAGEWIDATNTIEISTTAGPGAMQVAYHEALHGFFSKFVKNDPAALEVLKTLADDPRVLRQLERLLAGDKAALSQLKDGEERLAYTYQFWAAGVLDIPYGKPRTLFQKIAKFFRRVLGLVTDTERAAVMFDAFHAGKFSDPVAGAQAMQDVLSTGLGRAKAMRKLDGLVQKAAALTLPADSILANSQSPTAQKIGQMFFRNPGDSNSIGEPGYLNARDQMGRRYVNEFSHIVSGMDAKDYKAISDYMTSATPISDITYAPHAKAVKEIRALLKRFRQYMVDENGVKMGDQGDNYYPRVWSLDKLVNNAPAFFEMMATKHPQRDADAVYNSLLQNLANDLVVGRPAREDGVLAPLNVAGEERVLSFMDPEDAAPFLEDNLVGVMTRYFHQGVRAAEYTKRFGQDGQGLGLMLVDAEKELHDESRKMLKQGVLKDEAAADKWAERQMRDVRESVGAMEGTLGGDINGAWRATNSWVIVYQNIRLLPLSLFASFVDPMGMVARGAEFGEAFEAFKRGMTEVGRQWKDLFKEDKTVRATDQWERLAQYVGTVDAGIFEAQLADMYSSVYMSPRARAINETFFKLNGMEAWNRGMRVGATKAAVQFIQRHAKLPQADSQRWLTELGLQPSDIELDANGNLLVSVGEIAAAKGIDKKAARAIAGRVHSGINRWVTGAILTPNAAQRPAWSSDPHYSMFFHLKQFTYSFHQTILKRAATEAKHGNIAPLGALFWYIPVMIGSDIMKGMIQGGGELPSHMKGMDAAEWVLYGAERGGLMGLGQIGMDASDDLSSIAGPAVEQIIDAFSDPLDRTTVRALPGNPLYREALL